MIQSRVDSGVRSTSLAELSVLVRLLAAEQHNLVPRNPRVPEGQDFNATECFFVEKASDCIGTLINSVALEFSQEHRSNVLQVVAAPLNSQFPKYDFFVLHKPANGSWHVAAGYQCKQTSEHPTDAAEDKATVGVSVWIKGNCNTKRAVPDGTGKRRLVDETNSKGWVLLSASAPAQDDFLGFTVAQALPSRIVDPTDAHYSNFCLAEKSTYEAASAMSL